MSVVIVDANGSRTIILLRTSTGASGIRGAVLNCSEADYLQWWESAVTVNGAPAPPGGSYRGVERRAVLIFTCADTTVATVIVPAPALSIFLADGETVNSSNVHVAALIAAAIGTLVSSTGSTATAYLGGTLLAGAKSPL